jgi:hypothetical protein
LTAKTKKKGKIVSCAVQCDCCHRQTIAMKVDQRQRKKEKENFEFQERHFEEMTDFVNIN